MVVRNQEFLGNHRPVDNTNNGDDDNGDGTPDDIIVVAGHAATAGHDSPITVCRVCGEPIYQTAGLEGSDKFWHYPSNLRNCSLFEPLVWFTATPAIGGDNFA